MIAPINSPLSDEEALRMFTHLDSMRFSLVAWRRRHGATPPPQGLVVVAAPPSIYIATAPGPCRCDVSPGKCWS